MISTQHVKHTDDNCPPNLLTCSFVFTKLFPVGKYLVNHTLSQKYHSNPPRKAHFLWVRKTKHSFNHKFYLNNKRLTVLIYGYNIMHLKSLGYSGQQNLMEMSDINNFYHLNICLNFTNGVLFFFKSPIDIKLIQSNHNPEFIWRIRMKNKLTHVTSILTTWLLTMTPINNNMSQRLL